MIPNIDKNWLFLGLSALLMIAVPWWLLSRQPENIPAVQPLFITKVKPQEIVQISALTDKPIFNAERAPLSFAGEMVEDEALLAGQEAAPQAMPKPTLVGLVSRRRGKSVAIVKDSDGQTKTLAPGQSADGWKLVSVGKTNARFSSAGELVNIGLDYSNKAIGGPEGASNERTKPHDSEQKIGEPE